MKSLLLLSLALTIFGVLAKQDVLIVDESDYVKGEVNGIGSPMLDLLLDQWDFAFTNVKPEITIAYKPMLPLPALTLMINMTDDYTGDTYYHFAVADVPVEELGAIDLHSFPFVATGVVPVMNLPGFEGASETLLLDGEVLVDIYRGRITHWRDPRIVVDNQDVAHLLPNATINVFIRSDRGGISKMFSGGLSTLSESWRQEMGDFFREWPREYFNSTLYPNFRAVAGDFGMLSNVALLPNSIGFTSFPLASSNSDQVQVPFLRGPSGNILIPDPGLEEAVANLSFHNGFGEDIVQYSPGTWPMVGLVYFFMRNNSHRQCEVKTEFMKFANWALTNEIPRDRANTMGYAAIPPQAAEQVIAYMKTFMCGDAPIIEVVQADDDRTKGHETLLGISMCLLVLVVVTAASILMKSSKEGRIFSIVLLLGGALCYISVIFWYLIPTESYICSARMWLTCLGFSLLLVAMFAKTWQIRKLYVEIFKKQKLSLEIIGFIEVVTTIGIVLAVQLVILTVWSAVNPLTARNVIFDPINLESHWECHCDNASSWVLVQAVFFGLLLLWGLYVVYSTWHAKRVLESRWILIATYNLFLLMCIILPFIYLVQIDNDNQLYYMAVVPINFGAASTIFAVCMPVIVKRLIKKIKESWSSSKSGGTSNFTKTTHNSSTVVASVSITSGDENKHSSKNYGSGSGNDSGKDLEMQVANVTA